MPQPHEWYSRKPAMSRGALLTIIAGPRSIGKTFGEKLAAVDRALKAGNRQTVWVRRSKTELGPAKAGFFEGVAPHYPGYEFRVVGAEGQVRRRPADPDEQTEWITAIHFIALSLAAQHKGTEFPKVDWIIYDECFIETNTQRYLQDEVRRLTGLWQTINRARTDRRGRAKTRVVLLGNVRDRTNPYFLHYGLHDADKEWTFAPGGKDVLLHLVDPGAYKPRTTSDLYGSALTAEEYGYAAGDFFVPDAGFVVEKRRENTRPICTLATPTGEYGMWTNDDTFEVEVTAGRLPGQDPRLCTFDALLVADDTPYASSLEYPRKWLRTSYRAGRVRYVGRLALQARPHLARA